jgi:hypothetical protein
VIINEEETNREVCFGALHTKVLAYREPEIPPHTVLFDSHWPKIPCKLYRKKNATDVVIRVGVENYASTFGMISNESAGALVALHDGLAGGQVRFQAYVLPQPRKTGGETASMHMILEFEVVVYGQRTQFQAIGDLLSAKNMYLAMPLEYDKSTRYQNPHCHIRQQRAKTGVLVPPRFQDVPKTQEEIQRDIDSVFENLMVSEAKLPEKEAPREITTELYGPMLGRADGRYKHQKQALHWLATREAGPTYEDVPDNPSLWRARLKNGQKVYYNLVTNQETKSAPPESRGGILADDVVPSPSN